MTSTSKRLPVRMRALAQIGTAALFALALAAGCSSSSDDSGAGGGGTGARAGSAGNATGGKSGSGGMSAAGNSGTTSGGSSVGGTTTTTGGTGSPEGGEAGMPGAACGNGKVDPGEECDDGNTKDGDGCSSLCTNKCEKCETGAKCATDPNSNSAVGFALCYGSGADALAPATDGPAAGTAKNKLCQALIACVRKSNCAAEDVDLPFPACYCGDANQANCQGTDGPLGAAATGPKGPCVEEIARAAESRTYKDIAGKLGGGNLNAASAAFSIVQDCDRVACGRECFQDKDASACEKCALGPTPLDYEYTCPDYYACYFSADTQVTDSAGMPKLLPLGTLCAPAADCALRTGCAASGIATCYGNGTGPCAAEFAAAADSTDPATISQRLDPNNTEYPTGYAARLLQCEATSCKADCFPNASGGSGGSGGASAGTGGGGTGGASAGTSGGGTGGT